MNIIMMLDVVYGMKFIISIISVVRIKLVGRKMCGFEWLEIDFMMNFENL